MAEVLNNSRLLIGGPDSVRSQRDFDRSPNDLNIALKIPPKLIQWQCHYDDSLVKAAQPEFI